MRPGTPPPEASAQTLFLAKRHGIKVDCYEMSKQWVCVVDGDLGHINDLPKLVDAAIARLRQT